MTVSTTDELLRPDAECAVPDMPTERLEHEITTLAAHLSAATCRWLLMVAEFDRRRAYETWECLNTAQWLNLQVGISPTTGRQHVAVGRALADLPAVREAFSRGELSYSRVRAVCRVATPSDEAKWLSVAREATGSQLDRIVSDTIRAVRVGTVDHEERVAESRSISWATDDDGMYRVSAVLPPEVGALLAKLIRTTIDRAGSDPYEQRAADAFAGLLDAAVFGLDTAAAAEGQPSPNTLLVVHRYPDGTAVLEDGPAISGALAERLSQNADEIVATHSANEIRYSRRRRPSTTMRRFLEGRDRCCQFPGCSQRTRLHAHHVRYYSKDGLTVVTNLVLLCPRHHGAIHNRGWTIAGDPNHGGLVFTDRTGRTARGKPAVQGDSAAVRAANSARGVAPALGSLRPASGGARYDHHFAVSLLADQSAGRREPGPTQQERTSDRM
jgi:hypothetical protein